MIKKSIISTLLFTLITGLSSVHAGFKIGIKGGVNLARYWNAEEEYGEDPYQDQKILPGVVAGVSSEMILGTMFSIQPEILYSMKGTQYEGAPELGDLGYLENLRAQGADADLSVLRTHYLEIPLLLKLRIPAGAVTPIIYTGPGVSLLAGVSGYMERDGNTQDYTDKEKENIKDAVNTFDFGVPMGLGLDIETGPLSIGLDLRYTLGLIRIKSLTQEIEEMGFNKDDLIQHKNSAFSFMAGISIPIRE